MNKNLDAAIQFAYKNRIPYFTENVAKARKCQWIEKDFMLVADNLIADIKGVHQHNFNVKKQLTELMEAWLIKWNKLSAEILESTAAYIKEIIDYQRQHIMNDVNQCIRQYQNHVVR